MSYPLVIISGPAGVGKTTVAKSLLKIYPTLRSSVTFTTRKKREGMTEDKIMHHVSVEEFEQRKNNREFLEWAVVHGDLYGTHRAETEAVLETNPVLLNIDVEGARQLKERYGDRIRSIFLVPESHEQMVDHLKNRGEMSQGNFAARLASAEKELRRQDEFDVKIVNREGHLHETIQAIQEILDPLLLE